MAPIIPISNPLIVSNDAFVMSVLVLFLNLPPADDLIIYRRTTPRIHPVPIVINMPQIIRYDRAWIPLYKHNPSRFGWFFRVVPAGKLRALGFSELDKPFKGREGRNTASHTPPVAILSISAIYTDVIFAKGFCSFLNCFHNHLFLYLSTSLCILTKRSGRIRYHPRQQLPMPLCGQDGNIQQK